MANKPAYRSKVPARRTGFVAQLRAEWTKLRSVRRWGLGMLSAVGLTILISLLTATGSGSDLNQHPDELGAIGPDGQRVDDWFQFLHQPLTGDGDVIARVVTQDNSHEWAKAGVMIKESTEAGAPYAAVMLTPEHGVRLQANFTTDLTGTGNTAPRWLRLSRVGQTITGYESSDGDEWHKVGRVDLESLPGTVEIGFFVASPSKVETEQQFGSSSTGERPTMGTATFDNVTVETPQGRQEGQWLEHESSRGFVDPGSSEEVEGVFTVTGSGDIAANPPDDDVAQLSLIGITLGQLAVIAVGVLFITSEYKRGMVRTTFAANPRRGKVLAAKATVIGATTFVVGLIASLAAFVVTQPILRSNGFGPPGYPKRSLTEWPVLRAVIGAALCLALIAVFSLALGTILRRSAGAIAGAIVLFLTPVLFSTALPLPVARWLVRITPIAGFSVTQTLEADVDTAVEPWSMSTPGAGLGVLILYVAIALIVAFWLLRRRDA
jgi:ABC-type transport system involved in multi-copper enzyme maturation permease subunit/regulation of enolase protein 1 (concanavalin A-like superfamily)